VFIKQCSAHLSLTSFHDEGCVSDQNGNIF
jgi:hypothetical protein